MDPPPARQREALTGCVAVTAVDCLHCVPRQRACVAVEPTVNDFRLEHPRSRLPTRQALRALERVHRRENLVVCRIHDLRHTATCLWLARGVDPGTVQA